MKHSIYDTLGYLAIPLLSCFRLFFPLLPIFAILFLMAAGYTIFWVLDIAAYDKCNKRILEICRSRGASGIWKGGFDEAG